MRAGQPDESSSAEALGLAWIPRRVTKMWHIVEGVAASSGDKLMRARRFPLVVGTEHVEGLVTVTKPDPGFETMPTHVLQPVESKQKTKQTRRAPEKSLRSTSE